MSLLVFVLAVAGGGKADQSNPKTLSTEFVTRASTTELAKALLPPEIAAKVIGHRLSPPHLHWLEGYPARFWEKAIAIRPGFCQRRTYYVPMRQRIEGTLTPGEPMPSVQIKMAADCATATEPFVHLNGTAPMKAVEILRWLSDAQRAARGNRELKFDVDCRREQDPDPCAKGARRVLGELPVENTYILEQGSRAYGGDDWRISIDSKDAANHYWQVSIFNWATDRPRVRISRDVIPPF